MNSMSSSNEHKSFHWTLYSKDLEKLGNQQQLEILLKEGKQIKDILGIHPNILAELYDRAIKYFKDEKYQEALAAFSLMAILDNNNHDIWLGLGMALQMNHKYESAIDAYELAAICDIENPVPYFYLAKCLFAIHDINGAKEAIDMAIEYSQDRDEFMDLRQQAYVARETLKKVEED